LVEAIIAYVIANLLDVISTNKVLKNGGKELNPVMRWAMDKFGHLWVIPKLLFAGVAAGVAFHFGFIWMIWALAGVYGLVAVNNFRVAKKLKDK